MLSRIILAKKYGVEPQVVSHPPDLAAMLGAADAALLIGDAALRVDPAVLPFETLDLGEQWTNLTGLPMVFAVWAGRSMIREPFGEMLLASCRYGLSRMEELVHQEGARRGFPEALVREDLPRHIRFEFSEAHYAAIDTYLSRAAELDRRAVAGEGSVSGGVSL